MVAFATLLLGIIVGVVPVEVLVSDDVASVELLADGDRLSVVEGPPWRVTVDFGDEIVPRSLLAVARDTSGRELDRARLSVNLPRAEAEIETVVERDGEEAIALVAWESGSGREPVEIRATFDGARLEVPEPRRIELPPHDRSISHRLRVEVEFPDGVVAARDVLVGGDHTESTSTGLTALPVWRRRKGQQTPAERLDTTFRSGDRVLEVVTVEEGTAEIVAVVDPAARIALLDLTRRHVGRRRLATGSERRRLFRAAARLSGGQNLRFLSPFPQRREHGRQAVEVFHPTRRLDGGRGGVIWQLSRWRPPERERSEQRLADAVAAGALAAAEDRRRRAVLLILGESPPERSHFAPAVVRRYLERIRVPLVVWSTVEPSEQSRARWGEVESVATFGALQRAAARLRRMLDRQRLVWVEGSHLPNRVTAHGGDGSPGLRLVGGTPEVSSTTGGVVFDPEPLGDPDRRSASAPGDDERSHTDNESVRPGLRRALAALGERRQMREAGQFRLVTDVDDAELLDRMATIAGGLPAAYVERYGLEPSVPEVPETVILYGEEADFRTVVGEFEGADHSIRGYTTSGFSVVLAAGRHTEEVAAFLVHELVHLLNRRALGDDLPPWLEEGMAEEMTYSRIDRRGRLRLGSWRRSSVAFLSSGEIRGPVASLLRLMRQWRRGRLTPLSELLEMEDDEFHRGAGRDVRYRESAFFIRYLLDTDERFRTAFRRWLRGAREEAFGIGQLFDDALDDRFRGWLRYLAATELRLR